MIYHDYSKYDRIVFDAKLKRPGCVLLQAAYGGVARVSHLFSVRSWLVAPTDDLRLYPLGPGQLDQLIAMVRKEFPMT